MVRTKERSCKASVRKMFGRRTLTWIAQATCVVWEQVGLCWRCRNEERREPGANHIGRKYGEEETVKEGKKMDPGMWLAHGEVRILERML